MNGTIKRVTPPEGLEIPEGMVYVGMGGDNLGNPRQPYWGSSGGGSWLKAVTGTNKRMHYCLPADSPLLEPLTRTVNVPAGLPPVPEDGLEVLGRLPELRAGDIYYFLSDDGKSWVGPRTATRSSGYKSFALRRPPVAKPEPKFKTVPFNSVADFGDTFPVWLHWQHSPPSMIIGFDVDGFACWPGGSAAIVKFRFSEAADRRWSTSPLTKWKDAKPFTMEVPA